MPKHNERGDGLKKRQEERRRQEKGHQGYRIKETEEKGDRRQFYIL